MAICPAFLFVWSEVQIESHLAAPMNTLPFLGGLCNGLSCDYIENGWAFWRVDSLFLYGQRHVSQDEWHVHCSLGWLQRANRVVAFSLEPVTQAAACVNRGSGRTHDAGEVDDSVLHSTRLWRTRALVLRCLRTLRLFPCLCADRSQKRVQRHRSNPKASP
jgi:hypothetical protein